MALSRLKRHISRIYNFLHLPVILKIDIELFLEHTCQDKNSFFLTNDSYYVSHPTTKFFVIFKFLTKLFSCLFTFTQGIFIGVFIEVLNPFF